MIQNKVIARYQDGRVLKGVTSDFLPNKEVFHLALKDDWESRPLEIRISDLKAVFFVKDFVGDSKYNDLKEYSSTKPVIGRKILVNFKDGEVVLGTTQGYQPNRSGFFVIPADPQSNNERCFVVSTATKDVSFP